MVRRRVVPLFALPSTMKKVALLAVLVLSLVAVVLAIVNSQEATIKLLVATVTMPLSFLVLLVFAIGAVVGAGAALLVLVKGKSPTSPS